MPTSQLNDLESADDPLTSIASLTVAFTLSALTATAGGYACGLAIHRFGETGSASLWLLGVVAGYLMRRISSAPSRTAGWSLVCACGVALLVAETCWIRWNGFQGAESWVAALQSIPKFVEVYQLSMLFAIIFTAFGARSAYVQSTAA